MKAAINAHKLGKGIAIPIMVRPVANWEKSELGVLQALPRDAKPVVTWESRDLAWADVAAGIVAALQRREQDKTHRDSGEKMSPGDLLKSLSLQEKPSVIVTSVAEQASVKRNLGNLFFSNPGLTSQIAAYQAEETPYYDAGKKSLDEAMSILNSGLPIEVIMLATVRLITERKYQKMKRSMQLLSILENLEKAGLSPGDYGLPSIEKAGQTLKNDMNEHAEYQRLLPLLSSKAETDVLEPLRKLRGGPYKTTKL
jgi:hypothetical protein